LRSTGRITHEGHDAFLSRCVPWMAERLAGGGAWRSWIAELDDKPIGCVWVQRVEKLPNPNGLPGTNAYLSNFYVDERYRGRGYGSVLLREALLWCDASDIDIAFMWPTPQSRPLYARHGFRAADAMMERSSR